MMTEKSNPNAALEMPRDEKQDRRTDWICLAALIAWGYFVILWFPLPYLGIKVTLYAFSAAGIALYYLWKKGKRPSKGSYLYLALLGLLALSFALFENSIIRYPLFLLLPCLYGCWLESAAQTTPPRSADILDSLSLLIVSPFQGLREKSAMFSLKEQSRQKTMYVLIGVGVTLPIFLLALRLLAASDALFSDLVGRFTNAFLVDIWSSANRFIFGCLLALYLLSMLMSATRRVKRKEGKPLPRVNGMVMSILIGALCALYAAYILVQVASLAGVFAKRELSAAFYSQYARDGFFELCQVTLLNLAVFMAAHVFRDGSKRSMRVLLTVLAILTQALIVTAIAKMGLYMSYYGLTLLRVQTLWFMASLFVAFGLLLALQWKAFDGYKAITLLAAASILVASYANIGGIVARVNVERYLAGELESISMRDYEEFPYAAAPHLMRLYTESSDEEMKAQISRLFTDIDENKGRLSWRDKSVQQIMAEAEIAAFGQQ